MALFVLRKLIFQMRMRSHPVALDIWFFVGPFLYMYFHTSWVRTVEVLVRLRGCADSPEPSLVACVISTIISWASSFRNVYDERYYLFSHPQRHMHQFLTPLPHMYKSPYFIGNFRSLLEQAKWGWNLDTWFTKVEKGHKDFAFTSTKFISILSEYNSVEIPVSALTDCLQIDARLQIKLKISEYYARFNKETMESMAMSFRRRKVSFPIKDKKLKNYLLDC